MYYFLKTINDEIKTYSFNNGSEMGVVNSSIPRDELWKRIWNDYHQPLGYTIEPSQVGAYQVINLTSNIVDIQPTGPVHKENIIRGWLNKIIVSIKPLNYLLESWKYRDVLAANLPLKAWMRYASLGNSNKAISELDALLNKYAYNKELSTQILHYKTTIYFMEKKFQKAKQANQQLFLIADNPLNYLNNFIIDLAINPKEANITDLEYFLRNKQEEDKPTNFYAAVAGLKYLYSPSTAKNILTENQDFFLSLLQTVPWDSFSKYLSPEDSNTDIPNFMCDKINLNAPLGFNAEKFLSEALAKVPLAPLGAVMPLEPIADFYISIIKKDRPISGVKYEQLWPIYIQEKQSALAYIAFFLTRNKYLK